MIYGYEHSCSYPDRVICQQRWSCLPGLTGQVGVLDGHALITALDTGLLRIKNENGPIILCGGLAKLIEIE
jgi:hypothetical protein